MKAFKRPWRDMNIAAALSAASIPYQWEDRDDMNTQIFDQPRSGKSSITRLSMAHTMACYERRDDMNT